MKRGMKIGCGVVLGIAVLLVALVFAAQFVLTKKLKPIIQSQLPGLEEKMKVKLGVGDASVNLFLASLNLRSVTVGNPRGFEEPVLFSLGKLVIDVNPMRYLLGGRKIEVTEITAGDAEITVVRNAEGLINVKVLADSLGAGGTPKEGPVKQPAGKGAPAKGAGPAVAPPPAVLKVMDVNGMLKYRDHSTSGEQPMELALRIALMLRNFSTFDTGVSATLAITGSMAGNSELCKTDIRGTISPLVDPLRPTFDIAGDIGKVDLVFARPYMQAAGFGCDELSLKVKIICRDGVIDGNQSAITLVMKNAALIDKMPPGVSSLPELSVPVPIEGPISGPRVDMKKAVMRAVLENARSNSGAIIKGAAMDAVGGSGKKGAGSGLKLPF